MKKLLILAAAMLWTSASFADDEAPKEHKHIGGVKYTPFRVQFVPPEELAKKPNHPQATQVEYTAAMTVEGTAGGKPWTVSVPIHTYAIHAPRDAVSGNATGRRQYKPITFTVEQGASTPLLDHVKKNETITQVTLSFNPVTPNTPKHTLVIKNIANVQNVVSGELVQFGMTFQKITWTWVDGGKTASDDWEAPAV